VTFDGVEPITITTEGKTGYGNVFITLALAQASLKQAGITEPTLSDLAVALNGGTIDVDGTSTEFQGVLTMRAAGMGWGQIAKENGFRLGYVISALKSGKDRVVKAGTADSRPSASQGGAKSVGSERTGRVAGAVKGERSAALDRTARPETSQRPEKIERPGRAERPERPEKIDRPGKG
jgi:hypothetical protein